jgi:hypothetical protein
MNLKKVDLETLLGYVSATGLPVLFKAIIGFLHPSLYTLACGRAWADGAPACYADDRLEALVWLGLSLIALAYGFYTMWHRLHRMPSNPPDYTTVITPKAAAAAVDASPLPITTTESVKKDSA